MVRREQEDASSSPRDKLFLLQNGRFRTGHFLLPVILVFHIISLMDAYDKALKLLSMREHTEKEIREKLKDKGFPSNEIDEAISRLLSENSLSEERFAESYIRSRLRRNPEGRTILRMRLRDKGTPSDIADRMLSEAWENELYLKPLSVYLESLIRKKGEEGARALLIRKGFRESEIRKAFSILDGDISE